MNLKRMSYIFGAVFLLVGIAGFVPAIAPREADHALLFGIFAVDTVHNLAHIAFGILGLALGAAGESQARVYFRITGVIYAILAVLGFFMRGGGEFMGMAMNLADAGLHLIIAAVALYLGFFQGERWNPPRHAPGT